MPWNVPADWRNWNFNCPDCGKKYHKSEGHDITDCYGSIEVYAEKYHLNFIIIDEDAFAQFDGETLRVYEWDECIEEIPFNDLTDKQKEKYKEILLCKN